MMIVDAHLDLAYNVTRGRDPRMPASQQPVVENEIATVGLPDLKAGHVGLICATIFCDPGKYGSVEQARVQALEQLDWYRSCVEQKLLKIVLTANDLPCDTGAPPVPGTMHGQDAHVTNMPLAAILLLEGADPLRSPEDVQEWFDAGLRIVGLAWKATRYAGGTGMPGPLTSEGRVLVKELDRLGIIHDTSHLAEESFWQLMELTSGLVIASHSNCRSIVGQGDRHLTDDMIRAIASRGGVIGMNFFDKFLLPTAEYGKRRAALADVVKHIQHICDLTGSANHVGLGTDMDGGLGREQIPQEIKTIADLSRIGDALRATGFTDDEVLNILGNNWRSYFERSLATP
ncbi:MAG TPA: membrane dipeptidase [Tepidisphaeraceae bacterium]|nr:membrane dipeptidase [Tepidisphaeraceae bacterium]